MNLDLVNDPVNGLFTEHEDAHFSTRGEALTAALGASDPGDTVTLHRGGCALILGAPCDCRPAILVVPSGKPS